MPYSKSPEAFAQIFYDLLDFALESRERIEINSQEPQKIISRFYGFCNAWKHRAAEAAKMGNMELAAENKKKAAALMRYMPRKEPGKAVFLHKDMLSDLLGERITASEKKVSDPLLEAAENFAKVQHGVALDAGRRTPNEMTTGAIVAQRTQDMIAKHFGPVTPEPKRDNIMPVPTDPEELKLLAQINEERNAPPDKE